MIITLGITPAVQRSMTFDRLTIDAVNRSANVRQYASGKAVNAARVLHTLGREVTAMGLAGGFTGRFMLDDLTAAGIGHDFVEVAPPTRICVTLIDRSTNLTTELVEESAAVPAEACEQLLVRLTAAMKTAAGCVLAGSLPVNAPADFYRRCVTACGGKFVVLDASGPPLTIALPAGPTVVKPNRRELAGTVGMDLSSPAGLKTAIGKLVDRGPKWVLVTDGPNPTTVSDGKSFWTVSSPKVEVVSPIGSGDSFAAGLAEGLARGWDVPEAARLAVACGAANATTDGAGFLDAPVVETVMAGVRVEPL
jgi:tagatose 6-phosphate kinase